MDWWRKQQTEIKNILLTPREDRRILPNIPDKEEVRTNLDRRGKKILADSHQDIEALMQEIKSGVRYKTNLQVDVTCYLDGGKKMKISCLGIDISTTGILLVIKNNDNLKDINDAKKIKLVFEITPGSMPEGYEMKVNMFVLVKHNCNTYV